MKNRRRSHTSQVINIAARPPKDGNADRPTLVKKSLTRLKWYETEHLVAGLNVSLPMKYMLTLINLNTNSKKRCAWLSQRSLASKMGVSVATVERLFKQAKAMGIVGVRRVRTGKGQADQHNEYWLVHERMAQLQRTPLPPEDPSPVSGDTPDHPSPMRGAPTVSNLDHPSNGPRPPLTAMRGEVTIRGIEASDASPPTVGGSADSAGVSEFDTHTHRRRPPGTKKQTTDDRRDNHNPSNQSTTSKPQPKPVPGEQKPKKRKISTALHGWMSTRILQRARVIVSNPHSYVRKSEAEFLENLPVEVEEFLVEKAMQFLSDRLKQNPSQPTLWTDVTEVLDQECRKYRLPMAGISLESIIHSASEMIGLTWSK